MSSPNSFGQLDLSILGIGTEYPPYTLKPDAVETLAKRFHNVDGDGMKKVLSINRFTGIEVSLPTSACVLRTTDSSLTCAPSLAPQ